jgi:hypothetical protein
MALAEFKSENSTMSQQLENFQNKIRKAFKVIIARKKAEHFASIRNCQLFSQRREKLAKIGQIFCRN